MQINVLVTGIGGGGVGEQVLKALKLSGNAYTVIGTDATGLCNNKFKVDHFYQVPGSAQPNYIETLLQICEKHNVRAIIPGSEPELKVISRDRQRFTDRNVLPLINPDNVVRICLDKFLTNNFFVDNGFLFPRSYQIKSLADLASVTFFPVVIKPSVGGGGSANTMIAQDKAELELFSQYMLTIYQEFILQEYVGTPEAEYTVGVLLGMDGELINSIAIRRNIMSGLSNRIKIKNRTGNDALGPLLVVSSGISQGEVVANPKVTGSCEEIARKIGARGAINIQCRVHKDEVYVFEINPRFSGTTSLRAMVGYNEPDVLIRREILGEKIQGRFPYKLGHITRGLSETYIGELQ
ncbi:ATP-grasp domain-containing protein [Fulvivirgaceae bacterium PWU4]|uniref:ATP-grasp domain-containing protein n=1 Tax=Chryseosolibacter histidini TaxID=2782349 RepID=A0AAP2GM61_9BACT|nr:ATP-grasp domain-containing protein [Chryseosolibacter histidini]MBT1700914.1 ATP-grasp domain-containing protein [Chryseosolibacter histidini]